MIFVYIILYIIMATTVGKIHYNKAAEKASIWDEPEILATVIGSFWPISLPIILTLWFLHKMFNI